MSTSTPTRTPETSVSNAIENIVKLYGDLLFDLCESVLWSPIHAQVAFRSILKEIRNRQEKEVFVDHERAWVLQIACTQLRTLAERHARRLTPSEQIELDSVPGVPHRLKKFDSYFHRLSSEDQMLLLLKDKYGLPLPEIAAAMGVPEGSLKVSRQQALRALEDWIWESE